MQAASDTQTISVYALTFPDGKQYVGVSQDPAARLKTHATTKKRTIVNSAIKKYGFEFVNLKILKTFPNYEEAFAYEIASITELGTLSPGGYNLTRGGDGVVGSPPAVRKRQSKAIKKAFAARSPEQKKRHREAMKASWAKPGAKKQRSAAMEKGWRKPGVKERHSKKKKEANTKPGAWEKQSIAMKKAAVKPGQRERRRRVMLAIWSDPEFRKRQSEIQKKIQNDPEFKKRMKAVWASPEFKKKQSDASKAAWARRKEVEVAL